MLRPRWLAQLIAFLGGWFWLPCPFCNLKFAGFETSHLPTIDVFTSRKVACRNCTDRVRKYNAELWDTWIKGGLLTKHIAVDPAWKSTEGGKCSGQS